MRSNSFFACSFWQTRDGAIEMVPMCFVAETHRLIYNMTYQGHNVSLTRGQILTFIFQGQNAYVATRLDKRNTMTFEIFRLLT